MDAPPHQRSRPPPTRNLKSRFTKIPPHRPKPLAAFAGFVATALHSRRKPWLCNRARLQSCRNGPRERGVLTPGGPQPAHRDHSRKTPESCFSRIPLEDSPFRGPFSPKPHFLPTNGTRAPSNPRATAIGVLGALSSICHPEERSDEGSAVAFRPVSGKMDLLASPTCTARQDKTTADPSLRSG